MPLLSPIRAAVPTLEGLPLLGRGKVRDSYGLTVGKRLIYCTDGISIFDFVLNAVVPQKGTILMAMTHFWLMHLAQFGTRTHFIAAGAEIDEHIPEHLRNNPALQARTMVVSDLDMNNAEFIGRVALTGSGLTEYLKHGTVNGLLLPSGLQDGDLLPYILDTPSTKADIGHDEPLDAMKMREKYPQQTLLLIQVMQIISGFARTKGIFFADSKFEMGLDGAGRLTLGDEVGTPDSSRFWDLREWEASRQLSVRKAPAPFDKQHVREWGKKLGLNDTKKFDPKNPADVERVHRLEVPRELIESTTALYRAIFFRLTGMRIEDYLDEHLGIIQE
ncbi:MAG: Phosphoribosylaminoimidazole-succinocarboxamide synthase [Candidatus Kaiserbacteria bacterium]|nr:Phosphoribosylaminoimidazole-succinocarboxamide synthase [Candidatus Kaiserbacteria bacterium]